MVMLAANFPDLLEKDIRAVYMERYPAIPAMVPDVYDIATSEAAYEKSTQVSPVPDHQQFTGKIATIARQQGYDKTVVFTEYAAQIQIERKLVADDQTRTVNRFGGGLATSANRSREKKGAETFTLAFTYEPTDGDGAELAASDHASPVAGIASQSNEGTLSFSATNLETTRQLMLEYYDMIGERITVDPDTILCYTDHEETGWEIINSKGKVNTPDNNANFHEGKYRLIIWRRLNAQDWHVLDYGMMKSDMGIQWFNREPIQFFQDKDSDTLVSKYLSYYRCGTIWWDWRFIYGNNP